MKSIQVGKLKSEFSEVLKRVQNFNESFVIEFGKNHKKVAMIVPYSEEKRSRIFGQLEGKVTISDDFNEENEEINSMFYGNHK